METFELDELPELDHDMLDIFRDAATWPNPVSDSMRVELVSRGPLWLQNKDGPSLKTRTIEICLQIGFIKSRKITLRIFITICVSVAMCERSFSKLKLVKNYLRSIMIQSRLTNLAILSIERESAHSIDFDNVINEFASRKVRKINFDSNYS